MWFYERGNYLFVIQNAYNTYKTKTFTNLNKGVISKFGSVNGGTEWELLTCSSSNSYFSNLVSTSTQVSIAGYIENTYQASDLCVLNSANVSYVGNLDGRKISFIASLDLNGNVQFVKSLDIFNESSIVSMTLDSDNNIILAQRVNRTYSDLISLDGINVTLPNSKNLVISEFAKTDGSHKWSSVLCEQPSSDEACKVLSIHSSFALDDNILIVLSVKGSVNLKMFGRITSIGNNANIFIVGMSKTGRNVRFAKLLAFSTTIDMGNVKSVINQNGEMIIGLTCADNCILNQEMVNPGAYLVQFNMFTLMFDFVKVFIPTSFIHNVKISSISVDGAGNPISIVSSLLSANITVFDSSSRNSTFTSPNILLIRHSPSGSIYWAQSITSTTTIGNVLTPTMSNDASSISTSSRIPVVFQDVSLNRLKFSTFKTCLSLVTQIGSLGPVGGSGGSSSYKTPGKIKSLTFGGGTTIASMIVTYHDGTNSYATGGSTSSQSTITFDPEEIILEVEMHVDKGFIITNVGHIRIKTDKQEFIYGSMTSLIYKYILDSDKTVVAWTINSGTYIDSIELHLADRSSGYPIYCDCKAGLEGSLCSETKCYGQDPSSPLVCSGKGICSSPNTCSCHPGASGHACIDVSYCNNNSTIVDPFVCGNYSCKNDQCQCKPGFYGEKCQNWDCYGVSSSNSSYSCSGNGVCQSPNTCVCDSSKFIGAQCEFTICNLIPSNNLNVCSGHGICSTPETCICRANYSGKYCEMFSCFGKEKNSSNVCSGLGNCTQADQCSCPKGYYGSECELFDCFGKQNNEPLVCSNHGICNSPNNCNCSSNYYSSDCSRWNCYGIPMNSSQVCSGRGVCQAPDNCSTCSIGYSGRNCEEYFCNNNLYNSTNACSKRGNCISPDNCTCLNGYFGSNCENTTCYGISYNDTQSCSGNGKCTDFNNCVCKFGYVGEACQYPTCFGMPSNSTTACYGNGNCTEFDSCKCNDGFTGKECSIYSCFGVVAKNSSVCSGNGDCLGLNSCSCHEGFVGHDCKNAITRVMESIGKPKGLVKGKIQTLDMNVISAHFKLSDFKSINLANNCTNCTWTNLKYSWQLTDGYQFISSEPQYLLAYYHGKVTDGLYKLSFKPLLSLKGIIPSTLQGKVTLSVKFHNSQNDLDSVEFTESIPLLSSPKRLKSNATITPELGMALSTLFTIEEDPNNWDIPDILLGKLEFSFAFEYINSFGENILVRMNEFSKSGNASVYLPYLPNNQTKLNSVQIFVICRDDLSYEYSESIGHVTVLPNTEDPNVLITRIKNDHKLGVVVLYDQSENQNSDVLYESVKTISIQVENPSQTLSVINQLTFANSLETKLAVIVSSKLESYLHEVNQILVNEKISNGYLFKQRMSENDLKNTLSTTSNILSQGFVNVSSICSQLSSIILNQQTTKVYSDSIEANSYVSNMINITTSSFIKTLNNENITEKFKEITLKTDSILSKYDGYYKEIGLSLITFDEKLYENGNSTQLGNTKEFTIYKSGSPLPLSDLNDPIYITFTISTNSSITNSSLSCQFWNETTHQWEKEGCSIFNFNNETNLLTCQCNHTTLFAAFIEQQTPPSTEYLKQVSSIYIAQISYGSLFLVLSLIVLSLLIIFRKSQPVSSRYITPYFGMIALIIECAMLLITQRSILLGYANSVLGIQNDFENSQSSVLQLQNGDLAANIISNIFTIIVNTMTLTAIFSYLYQVLRFQMLKYFYHQISIRFNAKEPKSETLLKTTKLFLSTRVMLIVMSVFILINVLYWTLWVVLIRLELITGQTYTYIVSISFTCSILLLGFIICCMIVVDWVMTFISNRKERDVIENGQEKQEVTNIESKFNFSLNDLISGKSLEKLQKFDNLKSAKKVIKVPLKGIYENFVRLDSPLYFRAEMCLFVICFTFLVISQIIGLSGLYYRKVDFLKVFLLNDSLSMLFDILYMFTYLFVFGGYSLLVLLVHKIKKKQDTVEEVDKLLAHDEGLKLFEWFCEKEYSLENLQLYLEIKKQRNIFESLDDSQQVKTSINHIYVTYIKNGALKEVNIPSDCSKSFTTLVKKLESSDSNTVSDIELESLRSIGKKKNEIPQDLKESIKNLIESLQNQVLFNLSDTFSRFIFSQQYETYQEIVNNKEAFMKQANFE